MDAHSEEWIADAPEDSGPFHWIDDRERAAYFGIPMTPEPRRQERRRPKTLEEACREFDLWLNGTPRPW